MTPFVRVGTYPTRNFATVEQFTLLYRRLDTSLTIACEVGLYHLQLWRLTYSLWGFLSFSDRFFLLIVRTGRIFTILNGSARYFNRLYGTEFPAYSQLFRRYAAEWRLPAFARPLSTTMLLIVTAAVYWSFSSEQMPCGNHPSP